MTQLSSYALIVKGETPETGFAHQKHNGHFYQISSKNLKSILEKGMAMNNLIHMILLIYW